MKTSARAALVASFLFVSGLCALIYQTVWLREFRLIFGASTAASAAVLGIFMGGLGVGSALLGRRMEKVRSPLAWYGNLELAIAVAAAVTPGLLWLVRQAYIATGGTPVLGHGFATVIRLLLASLVLIVPTFLMGGTLPAVARAVTSGADGGRRTLALLYGTNTMGAVTGALISTFFLIEHYGNRHTLWLACGLNALVAILARVAARSWPQGSVDAAGETSPEAEAETARPNVSPRFVLLAAGAVGFAFMLMELVWYRMLSPLLGGSSFTFGLILAVALFGIGLGGWLYALQQVRRPSLAVFGWTCALEALFIAIPFALGDWLANLAMALRPLAGLGFGGHIIGWSLVTAVVILPAAVVAGYQFPMLIALLGSGSRDVARHTGHAYAANTAGAILGSLAGGFGLMPLLTAPGLWQAMVLLLAVLAIAAAAGALRRREFSFAPALAVVAAAVSLVLFWEGPTAAWRHGGVGAGRAKPEANTVNGLEDWAKRVRRSIVWEAEGVESSVALSDENGYAFVINGKVDGHIRGDGGTQVMGGLLPCLLRPAKSSMVIGLGTGSTAGWLGAVPEMERVDVVELEPAVVEVARRCAPANRDVLNNPKVKLAFGDAREALLTTPKRYDLIFSEPSNPYRAGIASLFTHEFYEAASARLTEGGVFAQWVQGYEVDGEAMRTAYASLASVFAHVETWQTMHSDFLLIASHRPFEHDAATLRARIAAEPFRTALQNVWNVDTLEGVLAHHTADPRLSRLVGASGTPPATDDRNDLEFGFARGVGTRAFTPVHKEVYELARRQNWHHAAIAGEVDWQAVDREREIFVRGSTTDWDARTALPGEDGARWRALQVSQDPDQDAVAFAAVWDEHKFEPKSYAELWLVASELAAAGHADCWRFIAQVSAVRPGDAEALWAKAFIPTQQLEQVGRHLVRALETWRTDAWASAPLTAELCRMAETLAKGSDRATARLLYAALRQPLCLYISNQARLNAAFAAASAGAASGSDPMLQESLAEFRGHLPWKKVVLEQNIRAVRDAGGPRLTEAALQLMAFQKGEVSPFASGLAAPATAPASTAAEVVKEPVEPLAQAAE